MNEYRLRGRTAATGGGGVEGVAVLWNASSTVPIWVVEIKVTNTTTTAIGALLERASARGSSPGSTVTPDIDNDILHRLAPPSTAVLDLANYGTDPTFATPPLDGLVIAGTVGAAQILNFRNGPLRVLPGAGLGLAEAAASLVPAVDVTFTWQE